MLRTYYRKIKIICKEISIHFQSHCTDRKFYLKKSRRNNPQETNVKMCEDVSFKMVVIGLQIQITNLWLIEYYVFLILVCYPSEAVFSHLDDIFFLLYAIFLKVQDLSIFSTALLMVEYQFWAIKINSFSILYALTLKHYSTSHRIVLLKWERKSLK